MTFPVRSAALAAIGLAVALAGCIESKNTATVNPDGATKVTIDAFVKGPPNFGNAASKPDPEKQAKQVASGFLRGAQGVDAWSDVTVKAEEDGRIHIKATAFASDINKFKLQPIPPVKWTVDAKGNGSLTMVTEESASRPAKPKVTDEEEIKKQVAQAKQQFTQMKPMMAGVFNSLKVDVTYQLPGTVSETNIYTKTGPSSVNFVVDGKKMLETMEKVMNDEKYLTEALKTGKDVEKDQDAYFEQMYGKKGPVSAKVTGATKAQFDYKKEADAAKGAQDEMLKKQGLDLSAPKGGFGPGGGGPGMP